MEGVSAVEACCGCGVCQCGDQTPVPQQRQAFPFRAASGTRYTLQVRTEAAGLEATTLSVLPLATASGPAGDGGAASGVGGGGGGGGCDWDAEPLASQ
eukprot:SAG22_NODE_4824_length_1153_cov_2.087985_1_plen_97_part_10